MALVFDETRSDTLSLSEFIRFVETEIDVYEPSSLFKTAPKLQALARGKSFFFEKLVEILSDRCPLEEKNLYTPQIFLIAERRDFFIRAVVWPEASNAMVREAQLDLGYTDPHDHNFEFLTVGMLGPGYYTHIFEYDDYSMIDPCPGDNVTIKQTESLQLKEGRCIYFRASKDIHIQVPPESISVSLNLIVNKPASARSRQNFFDLKKKTLTRSESPFPLGILFSAVEHFEPVKWQESLKRISENHPDSKWRNEAIICLSKIETASIST